MKAIVFATEPWCSDNRIEGRSMPFVHLQGRPLLLYVLVALDQVSEIKEIVIVGPPPQVMSVLEAALFEVPFSKKITVLPQQGAVLADLQFAIKGGQKKEADPLQVLPQDEVVLCLPGNIPLLTTAEIEAFLAASDMDAYDYCAGMTEEEALRVFYPEPEKSGIKKACIQLEDKAFRLNNLHLIDASRIEKLIEGLSETSTKIQMSPIIAAALPPYVGGLFEHPPRNRAETQKDDLIFSHQHHSFERLEADLSHLLQLKFKLTGRWKGGAAINIDDATSLQSLSERIDDWRTLIADLNQTEEGKKQCPTSGLACKSE